MRLPFVQSGVVDSIIAALQAGGLIANEASANKLRTAKAQMTEAERDALVDPNNIDYGSVPPQITHFSTLAAGVSAIPAGNGFQVLEVAGSVTQDPRFSLLLNLHCAGSGPSSFCTDGARLYYSYIDTGTHYIRAVNSTTGTTLWTKTCNNSTSKICTDGVWVYYGDVNTHLIAIDCATGTVEKLYNTIIAGNPDHIHSNGKYILFTSGNYVECVKWSGSNIVAVWTRNLGSPINCCYAGDTMAFIGGVSSFNLYGSTNAYYLASSGSTGAPNYEFTQLPLLATNGLYYDGDYLYAATTRGLYGTGTSGSGYSNVWKIGIRDSGHDKTSLVYGFNDSSGSGGDIGISICGDDKYIYLLTATEIKILDKCTMFTVDSVTVTASTEVHTDGISIITQHRTDIQHLTRISCGYSLRNFQRVAGTEEKRYPIQGALAIPIS